MIIFIGFGAMVLPTLGVRTRLRVSGFGFRRPGLMLKVYRLGPGESLHLKP